MNVSLFRFLGKVVTVSVISLTSFFGLNPVKQDMKSIENKAANSNAKPNTVVIEFEDKISYSYKFPVGKELVITEGEDGLIKVDSEGNEIAVINEMVPNEKIIGTGIVGKYVGRLTGYGPDCYGCSKVGNVACRTREKKNHSLIYDGITYTDEQMGEMRILAAAFKQFPCGTVIKVTNTKIGDFTGIVLDTGSEMRKYYNEGKVLLDLAYTSGKDSSVRLTTKNDVHYEVERWGW